MAKAKPKTPAAASAGAIDFAVLASIVAATQAGIEGFVFTSDAERAPLTAAGYIVTNATLVEPGTNKLATRATAEGIAALQAHQAAQGGAAAGFGAPAAATAAAPAGDKPSFALVSGIAIPERKRGTIGPRGETYPFGTMEVGQAFFIAATAEKPNPERSFASSVASATQRYAVPKVPAETRVTRSGNAVPVTVPGRVFRIARVEDGAAFGQAGVPGAGVWRTA